MKASEARTEAVARELLTIRGWNLAHPPRGQVLWKNEYRDYSSILAALKGAGKKKQGGDGYPDFLVVEPSTMTPLIVGETKADDSEIGKAIDEAKWYGNALLEHGIHVLAAGVAGSETENIAVGVQKHSGKGWKPIEYRQQPIQWLPTPEEAALLLKDDQLFDLNPRVPSPEILAQLGDEINRILRECDIIDQHRPAAVGAFMLGLWNSKGQVRTHPEHILNDINSECRKAFIKAGKIEIADSILVNAANEQLAAKAARICYILRLLNITTLTAEHDYLGQLYEMFFRFTGGNTIGQFFTPRHITRFMVNLSEVGKHDNVIDPACGTGGFLISALYKMIGSSHPTHGQVTKLVSQHLKGFESEPTTAALCVANMILRGDGTSGIVKGDCFTDAAFPEDWATAALGNPPFPHAKTDTPSEHFVERALDALKTRGTLAMIVPISILIKSNRKKWRAKILKNNTLRAVIRLPDDLFLPYAHPYTAIIILTKGVPHSGSKNVFFCHVDNDGLRLQKNVRVETAGEELTAAENAYHQQTSEPGFCTCTPLTSSEWAPGLYIESRKATAQEVKLGVAELMRGLVAFNSHFAPQLTSLHKNIDDGNYSVDEFSKIVKRKPQKIATKPNTIGGMFRIYYGLTQLENKKVLPAGDMPVISSAGTDNGCHGFYDFSHLAALSQPPFVTVPRTGSIGEAFVQLHPCGVTSDSLILLPRDGVDVADMFIAAHVVRSERWRFNYGSKITPSRIANFPVPQSGELKNWILDVLIDAERLSREAVATFGGKQRKDRFLQLADKWKKETALIGPVSKKSMQPEYQQIIGMGESAVPWILSDLRENGPADWFWALTAITGENPITKDIAGNMSSMTEAWLKWGKAAGYLHDYHQTKSRPSRNSKQPPIE